MHISYINVFVNFIEFMKQGKCYPKCYLTYLYLSVKTLMLKFITKDGFLSSTAQPKIEARPPTRSPKIKGRSTNALGLLL